MNTRIRLQTRVDGYLVERHRLGFELHSLDTLLADFAKFVADRHHHGPLTVELMADWVRMGKGGLGTPETWYRRMGTLRRFIRYLQQFEPQTEKEGKKRRKSEEKGARLELNSHSRQSPR
ncbi:MAG: hypothetical protein V5B35_13475 [Candidatus Accumulibacter necessarius]|jgi:hypothetical protein|uniref:hypothetical protein n=1 Tax=Candidatus Accumulibacter necessarius TaxID=2954386 RepID=UPI002FC32C73